MNTDLVAQKVLDRIAKEGVAALTEMERTVATAWLFDAGVSNGGFERYFASSRGDLAFHAPAALRAIGAAQMAGLAAEANAVFGVAGPPPARSERRQRIAALPESARETFTRLEQRFADSGEDIDALLESYLASRS